MPAETPEDFVQRVTKRISEVRRARGLTQDQVAERLRTATRAFQRIEAGQNLTLYTLARIARVLGVRPDDLIASDEGGRNRRYPASTATTQAVAEHPKKGAAEPAPRGRTKRR